MLCLVWPIVYVLICFFVCLFVCFFYTSLPFYMEYYFKIDIVVFREPDDCHRSTNGCDWTKLGVGATDTYGNLRWCCANDAIALNMCTGRSDYGRLIVNETLFKGTIRSLPIDATGKQDVYVTSSQISVDEGSGNYVLVMANCNAEGRTVTVSGWYSWKSKGGYLPGDLFGALYYFIFLVVVYAVLLAWYGISMAIYKEATIPIQKWILVTLFMGLIEMLFKTGDYLLWNSNGTRFWFALYFGMCRFHSESVSRLLKPVAESQNLNTCDFSFYLLCYLNTYRCYSRYCKASVVQGSGTHGVLGLGCCT
jgi:hypothetical protein